MKERNKKIYFCVKRCCLCCLILIAFVLTSAPTPPKPPPPDCPEPYISICVTPSVDLGRVTQPGVYDAIEPIKVYAKSSIPLPGVYADAIPLTNPAGGVIPLDRIFAKMPDTGVYVPMTGTINISGPFGPGKCHIPFYLRIITESGDSAGQYSGTIIFTIGGSP